MDSRPLHTSLIQFCTGCNLHGHFGYVSGCGNVRLVRYGGLQIGSVFPVRMLSREILPPALKEEKIVKPKTLYVAFCEGKNKKYSFCAS